MEPVKKSPVPIGCFLLALLVVWLASWLPIGLYVGDLDYVLTRVSRGTWYRQLYQGLLYSGLLLVFLDFWRRHAPDTPRRGRLGELLSYLLLGLFGAGVLKLALYFLGSRAGLELPDHTWSWMAAGLSALGVALVEEAVFRGFLLGGLAQRWGTSRAVVISSVIFSSVHLFRPGSVEFKFGYALGLMLLAGFLARLAWKRSIAASAGFHAGVIFWNFIDSVPIEPSWWAGWQNEASSGALAWLFTTLLWVQWEYLTRVSRDAPEPDAASLP